MISVIVPVYRVEPYLHQCVDSILAQTYRDLEIILVDDGSPDECGEICEEYAKVDDRIRVFHTENKGLSAARNFGLREAHGEYIGFVDSDDWIEPDMYEVLLKRLEDENADVSVCEFWRDYVKSSQVSANARNKHNAVYPGKEAIRALTLFRLHSYSWNKLYRKKCWENIWFPEGKAFEDVATLYKVFLNVCLVSSTPEPLYHYRIREDSITHDYSMKNLVDCWNAFYKRYLFLCTLPELKNDQELTDGMEAWLATLAVRTWKRAYGIPRKNRDYRFLDTISNFMRSHFPVFGKKSWSLFFRAETFFPRYANVFSFSCLHFADKCHDFAKRSLTGSSAKMQPFAGYAGHN